MTNVEEEEEITVEGNDTYEEVQKVTPDPDLFLHHEGKRLAEGKIAHRNDSTSNSTQHQINKKDEGDEIDVDVEILNDPEAEIDAEASGFSFFPVFRS